METPKSSLSETVRLSLISAKKEAKPADASENVKRFIPNGKVKEILNDKSVKELLSEQTFQIPEHKLDSVVDIVARKGPNLLAILIELSLESHLMEFVQADTLDSWLPRRLEEILKHIPDAARAGEFFTLQWEYYPFEFYPINYQRNLEPEIVVPYIEQNRVGEGGYSEVFKVMIHPAQQSLQTLTGNVYVARKRIQVTSVPSSSERNDEAELLFLLGSVLGHRNVVELLAAYHQAPFVNLIFPFYERDLHSFLLSTERPRGFEDDVSILQALQGLSSGLAHLHQFFPKSSLKAQKSFAMHGCHHDIKPRNVLVGNGTFVLSDFGCADIKAFDQDSKTKWKDTTFEYGAPECRDMETWIPGKVGRALDIWSLGCIFTEVLTYTVNGNHGVLDFRERRKSQQIHGKVKCFHDGVKLSSQVDDHIKRLQQEWRGPQVSIFRVLRTMFVTEPAERPTSTVVERFMSEMILKMFTDTLIERLETMFKDPGFHLSNILKAQTTIEISRLKAWNKCVCAQSTESSSQVMGNLQNLQGLDISKMTEIIRGLQIKTAIMDAPLRGEFPYHGSLLSFIRSINDELWFLIPKFLQQSVEETFLILTAPIQPQHSIERQNSLMSWLESNASTLDILEQLQDFSLGRETMESQNLGKTTAMRRLSLLFSKGKLPPNGKVIQWLNVERSKNQQSDPKSYLYDDIDCLVEWQEHGLPDDIDPLDDESDLLVYSLFERMQALAGLLTYRPKPDAFRVLDCMGTVHDEVEKRFGLLYKYPSSQTQAIRLYKIFRHDKKQDKMPNPSEKLHLSKALVEAVHSFHVSGWVHKNINSFNVLFFQDPAQSLQELDISNPFVVGFNHSRPSTPNAISAGFDPSRLDDNEYRHPSYRRGGKKFQQYFDYYSLGLLLLEIGTWNSLSVIYRRKDALTMSPEQLTKEYLKICRKELQLMMGELYAGVVIECLQVDDWNNTTNTTSVLEFKERVLDQIRRINI